MKHVVEVDDGEDPYFTNQFKKVDDAWKIVDFCRPCCEYCDGYMCDRMEWKEEIEDMLRDVASQVGSNKEKRFMMYRKFTAMRHGYLGKGKRVEVCYCVRDIILHTFPVEAGTRQQCLVSVG